jgi:hypothetical protein
VDVLDPDILVAPMTESAEGFDCVEYVQRETRSIAAPSVARVVTPKLKGPPLEVPRRNQILFRYLGTTAVTSISSSIPWIARPLITRNVFIGIGPLA